jgi:hypothetical protein
MLTDKQIEKLSAVQAKYADELMAYPNVIGVGIGFARKDGEATDEPSLVVMVSEKLPVAQLALDAILPTELDGVRVDVQATGAFSASVFTANG